MKKRTLLSLLLVLTLLVGAAVLAISISAEDEPALEITGANVSFEERVHLFYAVGYTGIDDPSSIRLLIWRESGDLDIAKCTLGTEDAVLTPDFADVDDGEVWGKVFRYDALSAAEMTENVYARAYTRLEDGSIVYSPVKKYSILQYALNKLGVTGTMTEKESLKKVLRTMLEYGAATQEHFGVNTDRLANGNYAKITVKGGTLTDGTTSGLFAIGEEVSVRTSATEALPNVIWTDEIGRQVGAKESYTFLASSTATVTATLTDKASSFGEYKHVAVIGVDGAGDFWCESTQTPSIDAIFASGAVTYTMEIPSPTSSGPSWMSHLHGVKVENHGINDNALVEGTTLAAYSNAKYPSFLKAARDFDASLGVAAIYGWQAFDNIIEDGAGIYKVGPAVSDQAAADEMNTALAVDYIKESTPELFFFHFGNVDTVGHAKGFGNADHLAAIETVDGQIKRIYDAYAQAGILEDTLFIVTSDHGGTTAGSHGGLSTEERYAMFAAVGKTVETGAITSAMENRDTALIALYALGIPAPVSYTGAIPAGLFEGVEATERTTYTDPEAPRYHVSAQTPATSGNGFVTSYIDKPLTRYMSFDGDLSELKGATTRAYETVDYVDGYFGEAVNLSDGYVMMSGFAPGTESFTISIWMKVPAAHLESTVLSTKAKGAKLTGIDFSLVRDTSAAGHQGKFNLGYDNTDTTDTAYDIQYTLLPDDYQYGWTHVLLVVNREAGTVSTVYDFGEFNTRNMNADYLDASLTAYGLYIGKDANNNKNYPKLDLSIDELMIFDGALTRNEINDLCEYYGKTPTVEDEKTAIDVISKDAEIFLDFNKNVVNQATSGIDLSVYGTVNYTAHGDGTALDLDNSYVQAPADYKLGTGSFSAAFWVNADDLSVPAKPSNNNQYVPFFSTQQTYGGATVPGFTFGYDTVNSKFLIRLCDGTNRVQLMPAYSPDALCGGWNHIAVVVDRSAAVYSIKVYVNFELLFESKLNLYNSSTLFPADSTADSGALTIGQYAGGAYPTPPKGLFDDFIFLRDVLTDADIAALKDFYEK